MKEDMRFKMRACLTIFKVNIWALSIIPSFWFPSNMESSTNTYEPSASTFISEAEDAESYVLNLEIPWEDHSAVSIPPIIPECHPTPVLGNSWDTGLFNRWSSHPMLFFPMFSNNIPPPPVVTPNPVDHPTISPITPALSPTVRFNGDRMDRPGGSVVTSTTQTTVGKTQKRRRLDEAKRFESLQNDEHVLSFTPTEVKCAKCMKIIQLDGRKGARYYASFWRKHKAHCISARGEDEIVSHG
jgi:hypothetical protein